MQIYASPIAVITSGRIQTAPMDFGTWLKGMRDIKQFSQRDLSVLADTSLFTIQKAERSSTPDPLSKKSRQKIAKSFGLDAESFVRLWKEGKNIYGAPWEPPPDDPWTLTNEKMWSRVEELVNAFDIDPSEVVAHFKKLAKAQAQTRRTGATGIKGENAGATPLREK